MVDQFQVAAEAVGAIVKRFTNLGDAVSHARGLAREEPCCASFLPADIREAFGAIPFTSPDQAYRARLCISYARAGIASTGTLLLDLTEPAERGATGLVPVHAVFLRASAIVSDLNAIKEELAGLLGGNGTTYNSLTTGPSRTADIERVLTIGVHGPKELHILLLEGE